MHFEFNPDKLYKLIPQEPETPKRKYRVAKRWKVAKHHHMGKNNIGINWLHEKHFMTIRDKIRSLYAQQNEYFYDRDWRHDNSENPCTMHIIACSTLYKELECNHFYEYEIHYHIDDSPFKEIITALLGTVGKVKPIEPRIANYFKDMRQYYKDDPKFFSHLSPDEEQSN
ncbi:hypothetical protein [Mucilaginibacter polytrichastri]|uniref:Uncharacterized protein n=1 Tax=Mucilaginibacter polytrichastri TaxID=1302689 RepID=A0A1Q5ZV73_9SPHI|nr:hypothetical protein [Mucilaginibacter polytrichastri]OKS85671.1 hypothetical protein RG47T_1117 [Mucilaginibacter polytrichastri]SFS62130.1 hypothetical protein SAMN04487890_102464 [Mucilaginibacter polytrichastri]